MLLTKVSTINFTDKTISPLKQIFSIINQML